MVGDRPLDRHRRRQLALPDQLREQLDDEDDLDVEVGAEVLRVVLGERDVVVRVEHEDALGAGGAPVVEVVLGEPLRLVDVPHLGGGSAAAPLLAHQPELVARLLQDLRDRAGDRRAVERRLAVDEQHGLAADRDVESLGPVAHVLLADRGLAQHRLVGPLVGARVPGLPLRLVHAALHGERPHRLDDVDRAGAEPVEVTGEQRVRAAQLARAALGAVDVVGGDLLDGQLALVHRDDVGVERRRGPRLVAGHLHHRADLAAELVARGEAVVRRVAPLLGELLGRSRVLRPRVLPRDLVGDQSQLFGVLPHAGGERLRDRIRRTLPVELGHACLPRPVWPRSQSSQDTAPRAAATRAGQTGAPAASQGELSGANVSGVRRCAASSAARHPSPGGA